MSIPRFEPGDTVVVTAGTFEGFVGKVASIDSDGVIVDINIFGRITPVLVPAHDLGQPSSRSPQHSGSLTGKGSLRLKENVAIQPIKSRPVDCRPVEQPDVVPDQSPTTHFPRWRLPLLLIIILAAGVVAWYVSRGLS